MKREIITEENKWLLEAITEQYEAICRHGDHIPRIESDILMENVRKFYENLHRLQRMSDISPGPPPAVPLRTAAPAPPAPPETTPPAPAPEPAPAPAPPAASVLTPAPGITVTIREPDGGYPSSEPASEPPPAPPAVPFKPAGPVPGRPEPARTAPRPEQQPVMDLFAGEEPTFNIRLKEAREKSLGPKPPSVRIENLKAAITINDKFMFINELFDGNLREYNETIETLNGLKNLDQASEFLDLMRRKNFWNTGSNAFRKLSELVERRF